MFNEINLAEIYITNGMAITLSLILLFGRNRKFRTKTPENLIIKLMLILVIISSIFDPLVFTVDGKPGNFNWFIIYVGNMWLYFANMFLGPSWLMLIVKHMLGKIPKVQSILLYTSCGVAIAFLIVNVFYPVVFSVDANNVYHRQTFFWLYSAIGFVYMIDGVAVYIYAKSKGGILKFFPVLQFIIPVAIGIGIQSVFYGITTIWPSVAISLAGLLYSLQNESLYMDTQTGLYSRLYIEACIKDIQKKNEGEISVMMINMNNFRLINDYYGNSEGDAALVEVANIIKNTIGTLGSAVRYTGDEFIVLLNTQSLGITKKYAEKIQSNIELFNLSGKKPYKLSASIGYNIFDMKQQTSDTILGDVNKRMSLEKAEYYKTHKK